MASSHLDSPQTALFAEHDDPAPAVPSAMALDVRDGVLRRVSDGELRAIRHPVELAMITPLLGRLSFLGRKLFEFLVSYSLDDDRALKTVDGLCWRVSASTLKRDVAWDSNDTKYLKASIIELQSNLVAWSSSATDKNGDIRPWTSTQLLGSVTFIIDRQGRHLIEWSFTPVMLKQLREHRHWFTTDMAVIARMRRLSTLALYKLAMRYRTLPGGMTPRIPWRSYVPLLTGQADPELDLDSRNPSVGIPASTYVDWRYFHRDVVRKAVSELNQVQDDFWIKAVPKARFGSRSIDTLQFHIIPRAGFQKESRASSFAQDLTAVAALADFGVHHKTAQELCLEYGTAHCIRVLGIVKARIGDPSQQTIGNPAGFFVSELQAHAAMASAKHTHPGNDGPVTQTLTSDKPSTSKGDLVQLPTTEHKTPPSATSSLSTEQLLQKWRSILIRHYRHHWDTISSVDQKAHLASFEDSFREVAPPSVLRLFNHQAPLKNPLIATRFFEWFSSQMSGPQWFPPEEDLSSLIEHFNDAQLA